jgi:hypothetical protein
MNEAMLYIVLHGSELVGVMTPPVDAALIAKPLGIRQGLMPRGSPCTAPVGTGSGAGVDAFCPGGGTARPCAPASCRPGPAWTSM